MAPAGAVLLGVSAGAGCPVASRTHNLDVISQNVVSITNFQGTSSLPEGYQTKVVNGFQVRALNEHSKTSIAWWIPSRGPLISGTGPLSSKVLHTLLWAQAEAHMGASTSNGISAGIGVAAPSGGKPGRPHWRA